MPLPEPQPKRYLWVRGETMRYRQELREISGCFWDRNEGAWCVPWSQRFVIALHLLSWSGCTLHSPVPDLPLPRPDAAFLRLRLIRRPLVLNNGQALAVVDAFYDVEEAEEMLLCYPLQDEKRRPEFFVCLDNALDKHFESQV